MLASEDELKCFTETESLGDTYCLPGNAPQEVKDDWLVRSARAATKTTAKALPANKKTPVATAAAGAAASTTGKSTAAGTPRKSAMANPAPVLDECASARRRRRSSLNASFAAPTASSSRRSSIGAEGELEGSIKQVRFTRTNSMSSVGSAGSVETDSDSMLVTPCSARKTKKSAAGGKSPRTASSTAPSPSTAKDGTTGDDAAVANGKTNTTKLGTNEDLMNHVDCNSASGKPYIDSDVESLSSIHSSMRRRRVAPRPLPQNNTPAAPSTVSNPIAPTTSSKAAAATTTAAVATPSPRVITPQHVTTPKSPRPTGSPAVSERASVQAASTPEQQQQQLNSRRASSDSGTPDSSGKPHATTNSARNSSKGSGVATSGIIRGAPCVQPRGGSTGATAAAATTTTALASGAAGGIGGAGQSRMLIRVAESPTVTTITVSDTDSSDDAEYDAASLSRITSAQHTDGCTQRGPSTSARGANTGRAAAATTTTASLSAAAKLLSLGDILEIEMDAMEEFNEPVPRSSLPVMSSRDASVSCNTLNASKASTASRTVGGAQSKRLQSVTPHTRQTVPSATTKQQQPSSKADDDGAITTSTMSHRVNTGFRGDRARSTSGDSDEGLLRKPRPEQSRGGNGNAMMGDDVSPLDDTSISELKARAREEEERNARRETAGRPIVPPLPLHELAARRSGGSGNGDDDRQQQQQQFQQTYTVSSADGGTAGLEAVTNVSVSPLTASFASSRHPSPAAAASARRSKFGGGSFGCTDMTLAPSQPKLESSIATTAGGGGGAVVQPNAIVKGRPCSSSASATQQRASHVTTSSTAATPTKQAATAAPSAAASAIAPRPSAPTDTPVSAAANTTNKREGSSAPAGTSVVNSTAASQRATRGFDVRPAPSTTKASETAATTCNTNGASNAAAAATDVGKARTAPIIEPTKSSVKCCTMM